MAIVAGVDFGTAAGTSNLLRPPLIDAPQMLVLQQPAQRDLRWPRIFGTTFMRPV
jgi:hypothetical protein